MDLSQEIGSLIAGDLAWFKLFIDRKLQQNPQFLEQRHYFGHNHRDFVVNYLCDCHQEKEGIVVKDFREQIIYTLSLQKDLNLGEPLHLALQKFVLLKCLLEEFPNRFNLNQRDTQGRTLIACAIKARSEDSLQLVLDKGASVNLPFALGAMVQSPLEAAIEFDFAEGVRMLMAHQAQLDWPNIIQQNPLTFAARQGAVKALEVLLESPILRANLEHRNVFNRTAMEELCLRMKQHEKLNEALQGIAMLLCVGAEPPRSDVLLYLLGCNRFKLLKAVDEYLQRNPQYVEGFVHRCHIQETSLHHIIYADHSLGSSICRLFGIPSDSALVIENLISRKASAPAIQSGPSLIPIVSQRDPQNLYAEFVRRYTEAYNNKFFKNAWSSMRWLIAEGKADWETVRNYAQEHPTSRTGSIVKEMLAAIAALNELGVSDAANSNGATFT